MTLGDNIAFKATYVIQEPFIYSAVVEDPITKELTYRIIEPTIIPEEKDVLERRSFSRRSRLTSSRSTAARLPRYWRRRRGG